MQLASAHPPGIGIQATINGMQLAATHPQAAADHCSSMKLTATHLPVGSTGMQPTATRPAAIVARCGGMCSSPALVFLNHNRNGLQWRAAHCHASPSYFSALQRTGAHCRSCPRQLPPTALSTHCCPQYYQVPSSCYWLFRAW
mmetsp:Transcript_36581/g.103304  ORF Transcript_36581/g.103304 Transcript_36581/m.103304 type:complete len:143 (+) Transcript_36581:183-611(+)